MNLIVQPEPPTVNVGVNRLGPTTLSDRDPAIPQRMRMNCLSNSKAMWLKRRY